MTTPAITSIRPDEQIKNILTYTDTNPAGIGMNVSSASLADNIKNLLSQMNRALNGTTGGNFWYVDPPAPSTFEGGTVRGTIDNNQDLHDLERKRILKRVSKVGTDIGVSTAAAGTLTSTGVNVSNLDTVVIDTKTYTFETSLTNVDGNVQIGGTAAATLSNLQGAINLTGTPGTDYALAMTIHPTVTASSITATTLVGTAKANGTAGNTIATTAPVGVTLSWGGATLSGGGSTTDVVVLSPTQLPATTTAAIGTVTTLGIVVQTATTFGTAGLDEVTGANPIQPKNLWVLIDSATGDPLARTGGVADNKQVWGLGQCQSSTDGSTMTGTDPDGLQMSLVVHNATNDDLELITAGDVPITATMDYAYVKRDAFQDCPEESWLGDGFTDGAAVSDTRETVYSNQGATAFTTTSSATLDLGTGFSWEIGDVASAALLTLTEGSGGGTSTVTVGVATDVYDNNAVDVNFNNGITADNGSDAINIGITADQIDFTGNATVTTASASTMTVTADSANLTVSTTTSGNVVVNSVAGVDIDGTSITADATGAIGITSSGSTISLLSEGTTSFTTEALSAATGSFEFATGDVTGAFAAGDLDVNLGDVTGSGTGGGMGFALGDSTTGIGGTFAVVAGNGGSVDGAITLETGTGGTTGADVGLVASQDITGVATRDILLTSDMAEFNVNVQNTGHWHDRADFHYFGDTNRGDNYSGMNMAYASSTATTHGTYGIRTSATVLNGTITASTAGIGSGAQPSFTTSGITSLAAGSIILVEGATPNTLNGVYEVNDGSTTTLTLRGRNGIGTIPANEEFLKGQVDTDASATGTIYLATVCVMRCNTSGAWEVADGSSAPLSYTVLSTAGGVSLNTAYTAGPTITTTAALGPMIVAGTIDDVTDYVQITAATHTASTAGNLLQITGATESADTLVTVTNTSTNAADAVSVTNSGTGKGVLITHTSSGNALEVTDGTAQFVIGADGSLASTPDSGADVTFQGAGAASVVTVDGFESGNFSTDSASATASTFAFSANNTSTGNAVLTLDAQATGAGTGTIGVTAGDTIDVSVDAVANTVNVGTGAAEKLVTVGSTNTTSASTVNAGSGGATVAATSSFAGAVATDVSALNSLDAGTAVVTNMLTATASGGSAATTATTSVYASAASGLGTTVLNLQAEGTNSGASTVNINTATGTASSTTNIASGATANTVTLGSTNTTSASTVQGGTGGILLDGPTGPLEGNGTVNVLTVTNVDTDGAVAPGSFRSEAPYNSFESRSNGNQTVNFNTGYELATATNNFQVFVVNCSTTTADTITAFTNNGAATNMTATTTGSATFSVGDMVLITDHGGTTDQRNRGLVEVVSHTGNTLTLAASNTAGAEFCRNQFVTQTGQTASACLATLSVLRTNTSGDFQIAELFSDVGTISYQDLGTGALTLQGAYDGGQLITTTNALGSVAVTGPVDATVGTGYVTIDLATHTGATATTAFAVTGTALNSADVVNITDTSTESATALQVTNSGDGIGVQITNTASTDALKVWDGITNHFRILDNGGAAFIPDSNGDFAVSVTGASGLVDIDAAAGGIDLTATAGPLALNTVTSGDFTVSSAGRADVTAAVEVDVTADGVGIHYNAGTGDTSVFHSEMERNLFWGSSAASANGTFLGMNAGRVSTTALGAGSWVVLSTDALATTSITATTAAVAATTDAEVTVASSAAFSVGMLVTITGAANELNNDVYEVSALPTGTTIRLRGPNGTISRVEGFTGLDLITAGAGGTIQQATIAIIQTSTTGNWQQGSGSTTGITYTNFAGATTRQNAYNNQGTTPVVTTTAATLDIGAGLTWNIGDSASTDLLTVTESVGASTFLYSAAIATITSSALTHTFTTGARFDSGTSANEITIGADGTSGTANTIQTPAGSLTIGSSNTGPGGSNTTVRTPDTGGAGGTGNIAVFAGVNSNSGTSGGTVLVNGSDYSAASDVINGSGAVTVRAGDDTAGNLATGANATFRAGVAATTGGSAFVVGGAAFATSAGDGGDSNVDAGAGDGAGTDGNVNIGVTNADNVNIAATTQVDVTTAAIDLNATGAITADAATTSNLTITAAATSTLTLKTDVTTNGDVATTRLEAHNTNGTAGSGFIEIEALRDGVSGGTTAIAIGVEGGATLNLGTGAFTQVANVNTGAGIKTTVVGSTNSTSVTTVQSGTGGTNITSTADVDVDATTAVTIDTATAGDASANTFTVTLGASSTAATDGPSVILTPGDGGTTGEHGSVDITGAFDNDEALITLTGSGGSGNSDIYAGATAPTHTAAAGSLFHFNDGVTAETGGGLYIQVDADGAGDTGSNWQRVATDGTTARIFFQTSLTGTVAAGASITVSDVAASALPSRPLAADGFVWESDALIQVNGLTLFNTDTVNTNEVNEDNTSNREDIAINAGGPSLRSGDILTIQYTVNAGAGGGVHA